MLLFPFDPIRKRLKILQYFKPWQADPHDLSISASPQASAPGPFLTAHRQLASDPNLSAYNRIGTAKHSTTVTAPTTPPTIKISLTIRSMSFLTLGSSTRRSGPKTRIAFSRDGSSAL